jgi:Alginate export
MVCMMLGSLRLSRDAKIIPHGPLGMRNALLLTLLAATLACAQSAPPPMHLGRVSVTGTLRSRIYGWDWFQPSSGDNLYAYSGNLFRVNLAEKRNGWDWDVEFAAPFLLGLPDTATAPAPQGALGLGSNYYSANDNSQYSGMVFAKQLFIRLRGWGGSDGNTLQAGRFEFTDGTELASNNATLAALKRDRIGQRLIGTFGFSDVGRSFDGLHYSYSKSTQDLTFVAAVPTRGVYQTDGWGWNDVAFAYASFTRASGRGNHAADTRLFAIDYDDWRKVLKTDNRPLAVRSGDAENIRIQTFGAHSLHAFTTEAGTIDALGWGVFQTGRWGTQTQRAYAFTLEAGYQPTTAEFKPLADLKPWIRAGYTMGSGDRKPNDDRHGTFFQILPTPRIYARFPFYNMMNTEDQFASLVLRPHAKVTTASEFHSLRLSNANDLWYSGGGVFQPWTFGYTGRSASARRSLANLYDSSMEYRPTRHVSFTTYFGFAQGRAAMEEIYPQGKTGEFGYAETLFRF